MRKSHFSASCILVGALAICTDLYAHTIPHDLEQSYINTYLPLFFFAKLLPFIGLGILAFNTSLKGRSIQIRWQFFVALALGFALGYFTHTEFTTAAINKVGLVLIGILLIVAKNTSTRFIEIFIFAFGATLGFEYGRYFLHTEDFIWYYVLSLGAGGLVYILLNNFRIIGKTKLQMPLQIFGVFLILSGLLMVLLT